MKAVACMSMCVYVWICMARKCVCVCVFVDVYVCIHALHVCAHHTRMLNMCVLSVCECVRLCAEVEGSRLLYPQRE